MSSVLYGGHWRVIGMLAAGILTVLWAGAAYGQLGAGDIEALRAQGEAEGWTFTVRQSRASMRSPQELAGLRLPPPDDPYWKKAPRMPKPGVKVPFPEIWDWRNLGGVTAVKDQGPCGSCWAFSTVGTIESAIKIAEGIELDLSEQHLLSCNTAGWGCSGAVWGYAWYLDTPDTCGYVGSVLEADYPYIATRTPCDCAPARTYRIREWGYVNGLQPSVDDIKYALMTYGPLGCSLYVAGSFFGYGGGVYNDCQSVPVYVINHAVVIVGWDDTLGAEGVWIIKNSWDTDWGEDGFCNIEYECNHVGFAANYVVYEAEQGDLAVTPATGFLSTGPAAGPFVPADIVYTLENEGASALSWQASAPEWLEVLPASGTLAPAETVPVTVTVTALGLSGGAFGGDLVLENTASGAQVLRWMGLLVDKPTLYSFALDTDPGWVRTGAWAFGPPQGFAGAHGADPAAAYTGANVFGYNLAGYYENDMGEETLVAGPFDFTGRQDVELRFMRWLGVESASFDHAAIRASLDGMDWSTVWTHTGSSFADTEWNEAVYDVSPVADDQPEVYVAWVMGPTDDYVTYPGWNIDDVELRANPLVAEGEGETEECDIDSLTSLFLLLLVIGDSNGDHVLTQAEVQVFIPDIASFWTLVDLDQDGAVGLEEFTGNPLIGAFMPEIDTNGDNVIAYAEVQMLSDIITPDLYALVDLNGNLVVDCDDLYGGVAPGCPNCTPGGGADYIVGEAACLRVPGLPLPWSTFQWSKEGSGPLSDGRYQGSTCRSLFIPNLEVGDSGTYLCQYDGAKSTYAITITVHASTPAPGGLALAGLALAISCAGICALRKRK